MQTRVLIVDDDPLFARLCARLLRNAGIAYIVTNDPLDALSIARSEPDIGLVLSDVQMPGISGRTLASAIHALHPRMPIVLMSADEDERHSLADRSPTIPFISKSTVPSTLVELLRSQLGVDPASVAAEA